MTYAGPSAVVWDVPSNEVFVTLSIVFLFFVEVALSTIFFDMGRYFR